MRVDGQRLADRLLDQLAARVAGTDGPVGCLATVVAADDELSHRQARLKHRACERVGMRWRALGPPSSTSTARLCAILAELADDTEVHGVFVHLPLPPHVETARVVSAVPVSKDVDGLRPEGAGVAASAVAALDVLDAHEVPVGHSDVVVVGDPSPLVRGLDRLLRPRSRWFSTARPLDGAGRTRDADVVVAAAYRPGLVTAQWVRPGAVVVDAASGDVDIASVEPLAGLLCASPGGIGPLTVARLLTATHAAAGGDVGTLEV